MRGVKCFEVFKDIGALEIIPGSKIELPSGVKLIMDQPPAIKDSNLKDKVHEVCGRVVVYLLE